MYSNSVARAGIVTRASGRDPVRQCASGSRWPPSSISVRAVGVHHDRRRMAGAGVDQFTGVEGEHRTERGGAPGAGQMRGEAVQPGERRAGTGLLEQQGTAGAAKLTHHGGGGQAVADTVADDQRDAPVPEIDDVVPVAADLQRSARGVIPHGEAVRQRRGAEHRVLQRHGGFPLLVQLVDAVQALTEASGHQREQRVILRGEGPSLGQLDPDDQHSPGMLQRDAHCADFLGFPGQGGEQVAVAQRLDQLALALRQLRPIGGLAGAHQVRRSGFGRVAEERDGQNAPGLPHPPQFLGGAAQRFVERIRLSQLLIQRSHRDAGAARRSARR